jgi:hypothetical protein
MSVTNITDLDDDALLELSMSDDSIRMELIAGCGFNTVPVLKANFVFTKNQYRFFIRNRAYL